MEIRPQVLREEISATLVQVNHAIDEVKKRALAMDVPPTAMRDANGSWVMIPLLAAKAQCLAALVELNRRQ